MENEPFDPGKPLDMSSLLDVLAVQEGLASVARGEREPAAIVIGRIRERVRGSG